MTYNKKPSGNLALSEEWRQIQERAGITAEDIEAFEQAQEAQRQARKAH